MGDRQADHSLQPLEGAEDQRPVRPGAGERHIQVVPPRLRREAPAGLDAVAEAAFGALEGAAGGGDACLIGVPDAIHHAAHQPLVGMKRKPLPQRVKCPVEGEGKCAVHISRPVSQWHSRNWRRVMADCFWSVSARMESSG